jgi:glycosyltransferase involved in cell wall biosynthesis
MKINNIYISILVPVFNEEKNISILYSEIKNVLEANRRDWELLFINDGSKDSSQSSLDKLAIADHRVKIIHFKRNYGQTAAISAGIDHSVGEIIIPMDADLQNDPSDIPKLIKKIEEGFDVCSGWRSDRKDNYFSRNLPSTLANSLISKISGIKLHDYGCSLKAYRSEFIKDIKIYGEMHRFIPIYASWNGAKVTEIKVNHRKRIYGKSNYGLNRVLKVSLDLLLVIFLERYSHKPIYIFGGIGFLCLTASLFLFIYAIYLKFFLLVSFSRTPLPVMLSFFSLVGILCILLGLLAEILNRTWHESQGKKSYLIKNSKNI